MMANLAESNPQAAREGVERAVVKLVHGAPLWEVLESEDHAFNDNTIFRVSLIAAPSGRLVQKRFMKKDPGSRLYHVS